MSHTLFVYGSLKDPEVFENVTGEKPCSRRKARLKGYAHVEPVFGYPVIRPDTKGVVAGELIFDVSEEAFSKLDEYEDQGKLYQRTEVVVEAGKEKIPAYVYVGA